MQSGEIFPIAVNGIEQLFLTAKPGKTGSYLQKKYSVDNYYQIAKPDEFLFTIKF